MEVLCAVVLCLLPVYVAEQRQTDMKSTWSCGNVSYTSLALHCPIHTDWFHVVEEISSVHGNCTTGETLGNVTLKNNGYAQLSVNCVGRQANTSGQCDEAVDFRQNSHADSEENKLLKVNFECITGDTNYNICEDITNIRVTATTVIYLASANFFDNTSSSIESRQCKCKVSGVAIAKALYVPVTSQLSVICVNCNDSSFLKQDITLINEIAVLNANNGSAILNISFNHSASSNVTENSAWIQIEGKDKELTLQCNRGLETLTSTTDGSSLDMSTTNFGSSTTTSNNSTTSTTNKPEIYLYIIGAVAGVLLFSTLIIVAVVVVCNMRRNKQLKKNPAKVNYSSTCPGLTHDAGGYCVIDTNRKSAEHSTTESESKKPKWPKWWQTKPSYGATTESTCPKNSTQNAGKDGVTRLCMHPPMLSTAPVTACAKGLSNEAFSNDGADKKVYYILESDPDAPQDKDIVFVHVPRGARPARIQQSGNVSCDPNPRERSVHLYSDVKDIDGASGGEAKTLPSDINPVLSLQNPKSQITCSNQRNEYEEVMASDLRSSQYSKARVPQRDKSNEYQEIMTGGVQPSHNPETRIPSQDKSNEYQEIKAVGEPSKVYHILEPDPDALPENDIVIVPVNPLARAVTGAVNTTGDCMHKGVEEASGKDLEDDDDELVMIDNILYNSGDPKSQTQPQHKVTGAVHSTRDYMHKGVEEASGGDLEDDDDELVMIDNILYKSSDPESQTQDQHKAPYPQPPTATNPNHSEINIPDDSNLHLYSEVDDSLISSRENPNIPLPLQNDHFVNGASSTGESGYHHYADIDENVIASAGDSKTRPDNNSGKKSNTGLYEEVELTP